MQNREITFVLRMRNESQAAIRQMANDLARLNQATNGRPGGASSSRSGGGAFVGPTQAQTKQVRDHAVATGELTVNMRALTQSFVGGLATMTAYGVGGATVVGTLRNIIQAGDAANLAIGRMTATLGSRALATETFDRLARSAAQIGVSVNDSVAAFQRFDMAGRNIGRSREDVLAFTETLQRVAVVAGTTSQEASAAFLQLGQGLASGRLQGDELRSILEAMPQVAQMIAAEMGVTIGEVRKLGEEGKIVPDVIFRALLNRQQQVRQQFDQMPLTVERAATQAASGMDALYRRVDETLGLSTRLAQALAGIGEFAQRTADRSRPETAQDRFTSIQAELNRRITAQEQAGQPSIRNRAGRNSIRSGLAGSARTQGNAQDDAEIRLLRDEQEAVAELMRAEMRLAAHRQLAERDDRERQGRETEEARIRMEARDALQAFGLDNDRVAQQVEALRRVQDAGAAAFDRFGLSAEQAGRMVEALREKMDPYLATLRSIRQETEAAQAAGGGSFQADLYQRIQQASANGVTELAPDQLAQIAEDLRRLRGQQADNSLREVQDQIAVERRLSEARRSGNFALEQAITYQREYEKVLRETQDATRAAAAAQAAVARAGVGSITSATGRADTAARVPARYVGMVQNAAQAAGIDPVLFQALIGQEGGWQRADGSFPVSRAGARSIGQIMPATARQPGYGMSPIDLDAAERDPAMALRWAAQYLAAMIREAGSVQGGVAAYNAGLGRVQESIRTGAPLPAETQGYVRNVLSGGVDPTTGRPVLERSLSDPTLLQRNQDDALRMQRALNDAQAAGRIGMQEGNLFLQAWNLTMQETTQESANWQEVLGRNIASLREQNRMVSSGEMRADLERVRQSTTALQAEYQALQGTNAERALEIERIRVRRQLETQGRAGISDEDVTAQARANLQQRQAQFDIDANTAIRDRVAAMRDEVSLLGLSGDALEEQRLILEFQAQARRQNVTLAQGEVDLIREGIREMQAIRTARESDPMAGMIAGLRQWGDETRDIARQVQDATVSMANGMTDAVTEFAMTGKANVNDFANSVIRSLIRIAAQQLVVKPILQAAGIGLNALFPGSGAVAGAVTGIGSPGGMDLGGFVPQFHRGGLVGRNSGMAAFYDPALFHGARRFHSGGIPGLGAGEVPIIAKRNEAIMPTVRLPDGTFGVRAMGGGDAGTFAPVTNIEVNVGGGGGSGGAGNSADQQRMGEAIAKQIGDAMDARMSEYLSDQKRAGGMLSAGMRI
jgi:lambda family phage tail tape measure protein